MRIVSRVETNIAATVNGTRYIYIVRAVHRGLIFGRKRVAGKSIHCSVGMGFQGLVVVGGENDILFGRLLFVA